MTQEQVIAGCAAVLTTARETNGGPESAFYLALGCDLALWNAVRGILTRAGWATFSGNVLTLTADGAKKAKAIDALLTKSK